MKKNVASSNPDSWFNKHMKEGVVKRCPTQDKWRGREGYICPVAGCEHKARDKYEMGRHFRRAHPELLDEEETHHYRQRDTDAAACDKCDWKGTQHYKIYHKCKGEKKSPPPAKESAKKK